MTVNRRKKDTKFRGSHTHGWGSKKKHRGAGNRGGKGMAGTGKRAGNKWPSVWDEDPAYFGKHGFSRIGTKKLKCVNISYVDQNIEKWAKASIAKQQDSSFVINIKDLGFDKLLGSGKVHRKLKITADYASTGAIEAVKDAGGEVTVIKARPSK